MRGLVVALCGLMVACSAEPKAPTKVKSPITPVEQPVPPVDVIPPTDIPLPLPDDYLMPPVKAVPSLHSAFPNAAITIVRQTPADFTAGEPDEGCRVERSGIRPVPDKFDGSYSSPDETNILHFEEASFLGGDHNVFDQITGIVKGLGSQAIIETPTEMITLTSTTEYGMGFGYARGELGCGMARGLMTDLKQIGPLTHATHSGISDLQAEKRFIRGRITEGCISVLDEDNAEYLAVFPEAMPAHFTYRLMRFGLPTETGAPRTAWLRVHPMAAYGRTVELDKPITACPAFRHAMLLRDKPVMTLIDVTFPLD